MAVTIPAITPLAAIPVRGAAIDATTYRTQVDGFTGASGLPLTVTQINAAGAAITSAGALIESQAAQVEDDASDVGTAKTVIEAMYADIINSTSSAAVGTSTASVTIGTGSKPFAAGAGTVGKAWPLNQPVFAVAAADPTKSMWGELTAYNPTDGSFTINSQVVAGSGTVASWVIYLSLPRFLVAPNVAVTTKTDTASTTSTAWADTGLQVTITLKNATSKVLVRASMMLSGAATGSPVYFRLVRGSTPLAQGDAAGVRERMHFAGYIDPSGNTAGLDSTSGEATDTPGSVGPHTYKVQWRCAFSGTARLNRSADDSDATAYGRAVSTISAMEIAA